MCNSNKLYFQGLGIRPRTPSWDARLFDAGQRAVTPTSMAFKDEEDDHDALASVAETDTTDTSAASEVTSQGSLTSVD